MHATVIGPYDLVTVMGPYDRYKSQRERYKQNKNIIKNTTGSLIKKEHSYPLISATACA